MEKEEINKKVFGNLIRQTRKQMEMTGETLSRLCGVNPVFIRKIESGRNLPSLPVFIKICNALSTSPQYFLQNELNIEEISNLKAECIALLDKATGKQLKIVLNVVSVLLESLKDES